MGKMQPYNFLLINLVNMYIIDEYKKFEYCIKLLLFKYLIAWTAFRFNFGKTSFLETIMVPIFHTLQTYKYLYVKYNLACLI